MATNPLIGGEAGEAKRQLLRQSHLEEVEAALRKLRALLRKVEAQVDVVEREVENEGDPGSDHMVCIKVVLKSDQVISNT